MKGSGRLIVSMLAASTVALTSSSSSKDVALNQGYCSPGSTTFTASDKEKFAPRFDGLKFIETLVTAHR